MHLVLIGIAIAGAVWSRWRWSAATTSWSARWQTALLALLLPPLLLGMTAVTVLRMGHHGQMMGLPVGWIGCLLSLGFLGYATFALVYWVGQGWRSRLQLSHCSGGYLGSHLGYVLDTPALLAAQVGFWQPQLVVSQGLLQTLTPAQLHAVLTHEQAHHHYRDTFWFFWLGWVKRLTSWLPNTAALWQELLLLRELRADRWAAQQVDPLLLAESLLRVVQPPLDRTDDLWVAFGETVGDRLEQRIDALISPTQPLAAANPRCWIWLIVGLLPLLALPFHT